MRGFGKAWLAVLALAGIGQAQDEPKAPAASILSAKLDGAAAGGETRFQVELRLHSGAKGWQKVRVLPANAPVAAARATRGNVLFRRGADGLEALMPEPGDYAAKLTIAAPILKKGKLSAIELALPEAPAVSIQLRLPARGLAVETEPKCAAAVEGRVATIYPAGTRKLTIRWLPKRLAREMACVYSLSESSQIDVAPGSLMRRAALHFYPARGEFKSFELRVRGDATVRSVQGEDIESWRVVARGDAKLLRVRLSKPQTERYDVEVRMERAVALPPAEVSVEPLRDARATHQRGYLAFLPSDAVAIRERGKRQATLFDVRTLDGDFVGVKHRAQRAYRFDSAAAQVSIDVIPAQPKLTAQVSSFVMLDHGLATLRTWVDYDLRGPGVYELRLALSEGLAVVEVDGRDVKAWRVDGRELTVRLRERIKGKYGLNLTSQQLFRKTNGIAVPRIETLGTESEVGYIGVSAAQGVHLQHSHSTRMRQVETNDLPDWLSLQKPRLAYAYRSRGGSLSVSTIKIEPEVAAKWFTYVEIGAQRVRREVLAVCTIRKAGIFGLRMTVPQGVTITDVQGPLIDDWTHEAGELRVKFSKEVRGAYHFQLYAETLQPSLDPLDLRSIQLHGAQQVEGWLGIGTKENFELSAARVRGATAIRLKATPEILQSRPEMALAYRFDERPWQAAIRATPVEPRVQAHTFSVLRFRYGNVAVDTQVRYTIEKAGVRRLVLQLPADALNVSIDARGIRGVERQAGAWRVDLDQLRRGSYQLDVSYELVLAGEQRTFTYKGVVALDAERQSGKVVACQERTDVEVGLAQLQGAATADLTPAERQRVRLPVVAAFHYGAAERSIGFAVAEQRLTDAMLQASVPTCEVNTLIKRDGRAVHYLEASIQNTKKQFLTVTLGKTADLWATYLGGEPVKPSESGPGTYTIPLTTKAGWARRVEMIWTERLPQLGVAQRLDFKTPQFDVQVQQTQWRVFLPRDYQIAGTGGNVEMVSDNVLRATFLGMLMARSYVVLAWGLLLLICLGVPALCVGIIVWAVRRRTRLGYVLLPMPVRVPRLLEALVAITIIAVLAAMLLPSLNRAREQAKAPSGQQNLKNIGLAIQMYISDNGGYLMWDQHRATAPNAAQKLQDQLLPYTESTDVFVSPDTGLPYAMIGNKTKRVADPSERMVVVSQVSKNGGRNVLFLDAHVEWMRDDEFRRKYREQTGEDLPEALAYRSDVSGHGWKRSIIGRFKNMFSRSTAKLGGQEEFEPPPDEAMPEGPPAEAGQGQAAPTAGPAGAERRLADATIGAKKLRGKDLDERLAAEEAQRSPREEGVHDQLRLDRRKPQAAAAKAEEAEALVEEKRRVLAARLRRHKIANKRKLAEQNVQLGLAQARKGDYDAAVKALQKAIELDQMNVDAVNELRRIRAVEKLAKESLSQQLAQEPQLETLKSRAEIHRLLTPAAKKRYSERKGGPRKRPAGLSYAYDSQKGKQTAPAKRIQDRERQAYDDHIDQAIAAAGGGMGGLGGIGGGGQIVEEPSAKGRFFRRIAGQEPAAGQMIQAVFGGKAQGALPIRLEFPTRGTVPYLFRKAFSGDRQAELTIRCVRAGAAITMQGATFLVLMLLLLALAQKAPRTGPAFAAVLVIVFMTLDRYAAPAMKPYYQSAIAGLVAAIALVLVHRAYVFARCRGRRWEADA